MFAFNRSAFTVLLPLALLVAAVLWSNREPPAPASAEGAHVAVVVGQAGNSEVASR